MRRIEERLKDLGIDVPKPSWESDRKNHELSGAELRYGMEPRIVTMEGESYQYETIVKRTSTKKGSPAGGIGGAPPLKRTKAAHLVSLETGRVVLLKAKEDNYSEGSKVSRVLIDLGTSPSSEEVEATKKYAEQFADLRLAGF